MFLGLSIHPVLVAIVLGSAFAISRAMGLPIHSQEMIIAAAISLAAAELAMIPLFLSRHASQDVMSQAALMTTGLHMLLAAGAGGFVSFKLIPGQLFLYWMCGFYWVTLMSVAYVSVRAIRKAPIAPANQRPTAV